MFVAQPIAQPVRNITLLCTAMSKKVFAITSSHRSKSHYYRYRSSLVGVCASLILIILAIIGALPSLWKKKESTSNHKRSRQDNTAEAMEQTITYVEVPSNRSDVKRYKATYHSTNEPISIQSWMTLVSSNTPSGIQASTILSNIIASSPYPSILFETPGTSLQTSSSDQFEFALINEPALQRFAESSPDRYAFNEHFETCLQKSNGVDKKTVCSFANLGGDASLVSPLPQPNVKDEYYSHLAIFVRNAPKEQISEFWREAATTHLDVLKQRRRDNNTKTTWFSTNGMGVSWLHLRIDSWPKYYSYTPFK